MATNVRPNYFNLQTLDVQDVQQEHDYLTTKIEEGLSTLSLQGVTDLSGLKVTPDGVLVESSTFPLVSYDSARPELKNYIDLPFEQDRTKTARVYSVFLAKSNNIQRLDLRLQVRKVTNTSFVAVSLVSLKNPLSPASELGTTVLTRRIYNLDDLPALDSTEPVVLDFSGDNDRAGISLTVGNYYAVLIEFTRETASQDELRVFHSNREETALVDSALHSWIYFGTRFQQGLFTQQAAFESFVVYHKVYSAAVQVSPGTVFVNGRPIRVPDTQRYLGLVDRGNDAPANYVVASWKEETAATESAARTGNKSVSRLQDSFEVNVYSAIQYSELIRRTDVIFATLAVVRDRNVQSFKQTQTFTLDANSNLAYHDWLVPSNTHPSIAALTVVKQRPSDFVFVADNVPFEIPLTDYTGSLSLDAEGRQRTDRITQVFLDVFLDGGKNKQSLQMYVVKETSSSPSYRTFAATITDPDNTDLVSYSYPFDIKQLAQDTYYNFRAVTAAGNQIYIQDFDRAFGKLNPVTNKVEPLRAVSYEVVAEEGDIVLQIDEDLKLGESALSSGAAGIELVGYKASYKENEAAAPIGVATVEAIRPQTDNLLETTGYLFGPLPVVTREAQLVTNTDQSVQAAYAAGDLTLLVDGVDITYSGTQNADKGGKGSPMTVFGELTFGNKQDYVGARIILRNADGKDNTQQTTIYKVGVDVNNKVQFTAICLGKAPGSEAGFEQGESVYVFIDDRPALDANQQPIVLTFNEFSAAAIKVYNVGSRRYFTGKKIVSAGEHIVANQVVLDENEVAIDPVNGKVYFADGEKPIGNVTIQYLYFDQKIGKINYYQTKNTPFGTAVATPIANNDNAVLAAIARSDIVIKFGGKDIRSLDCTPEGPAKVFSEQPDRVLPAYGIAINPETGKIIFEESYSKASLIQGETPILTPETVVEVSYYQLIPQTVTTASQLLATYELRFDLNSDGRIDGEDSAIFKTAFGSHRGDSNYLEQADYNRDGYIDAADQEEFARHFGTVASGKPLYQDSTAARLSTIFAFEKGNPSNRVKFVRALSKSATSTEVGKTLLFLSTDTPIQKRGVYLVTFGYPNLLEDTISSFTVSTSTDFVRPIEYGSIRAFEKSVPTNTRTVVTSRTTTRIEGGRVAYDTEFTLTPPIRESSTWTFESTWLDRNLDIFNRRKFVSPVEYENSQRQVKGPFDLILAGSQFGTDGTFIELAIGPRDSIYANGVADPSGKLIHGQPISDIKFKAHLRVPRNDGTQIVDEWVWSNLQVNPESGLLRLEVGPTLQKSKINQGRNGITVLQPFGTAPEQVNLKPEFAGGDVANDLSNILLYREEDANTIPIHSHLDDESGGLLTSDAVKVINEEGDFSGVQPTLTLVLKELRRLIAQNILLGDFGNELVLVSGCSRGYGGTQPPIRIPTQVGDTCYEACGPIVSLNPSVPPNPIPGVVSGGSQYYYYYDDQCPSCDCLVQIKVGESTCGYFEVEYCVDPCFSGSVLLNFNWAACGYACECPPPPPKRPVIGTVTPFQACTYHFNAEIDCGDPALGEPSYYWDLGDGVNTSNLKTFDFEYTTPGTYKVTLVATCSDGRIFTDEIIIVVS